MNYKQVTFLPTKLQRKRRFEVEESPFFWIPDEIILKIFTYLNPKEVTKVALSCRFFAGLTQDNFLWHSLYYKKYPWGPNIPYIDKQIDSYDWRKKFQRRFNSDSNIRKRRFKLTSFRPARGQLYVECQYKNNLICLSTDDNKMDLYEIELNEMTTYNHLFNLENIEPFSIHIAAYSSDVFVSSTEKELLLFSKNGQLVENFKHSEEYCKISTLIEEPNKFIFSGAKILRLYSQNDPENFLEFSSNKLFSDFNIKNIHWYNENLIILQPQQSRIVRVFDKRKPNEILYDLDNRSEIAVMKINNGNIATGMRNGSLKVWDVLKGKEIFQAHDYDSSITDLILEQNNLISCAGEEIGILIYDLQSSDLIQTIADHTTSIWSLAYSDRKLVSGSMNCLKIWSTKNIYQNSSNTVLKKVQNLNLGSSRMYRSGLGIPERIGSSWLAFDNERVLCNCGIFFRCYDFFGLYD
ncbi:f-box and wd repeat domain-containing [Anaeramoeba flamelloides]|uniref:F-box and wd repeat domain-containing n=1 Tax=Anaeramoeba flamelloides TaxID=1746091 RepID=A0AAV8A8D4_9EUKA|nr:f-box and wd repeat domain-containing [Anaeramoeba flamelloides]